MRHKKLFNLAWLQTQTFTTVGNQFILIRSHKSPFNDTSFICLLQLSPSYKVIPIKGHPIYQDRFQIH